MLLLFFRSLSKVQKEALRTLAIHERFNDIFDLSPNEFWTANPSRPEEETHYET